MSPLKWTYSSRADFTYFGDQYKDYFGAFSEIRFEGREWSVDKEVGKSLKTF